MFSQWEGFCEAGERFMVYINWPSLNHVTVEGCKWTASRKNLSSGFPTNYKK